LPVTAYKLNSGHVYDESAAEGGMCMQIRYYINEYFLLFILFYVYRYIRKDWNAVVTVDDVTISSFFSGSAATTRMGCD